MFEIIRYANEGFYPHPAPRDTRFYNLETRQYENVEKGCYAFFEQVEVDALTGMAYERQFEKKNVVQVPDDFEIYASHYTVPIELHEHIPSSISEYGVEVLEVDFVRTDAITLLEWLMDFNNPDDFIFLQVYLDCEMIGNLKELERAR